MIPSLGNFALWFCLLFALLQFLISCKQIHYPKSSFIAVTINGLLFSSLISFFSLMYSYVVSDFSVLNVYQNSHTTKPLLYKISGVWGNHEGSMLLWILVLSIFNYFIFKLYNQSNFKFILKTLQTQSIVTVGFLLFTIFTSNPFKRMSTEQPDGLGFNPLLQDPALAIHPPLLYIGYVGFSAAFSFGVAAMTIGHQEKIPWYSYMKPFVLTSWSFLTIGIAFGSIWAYYELGWGGWWFWDPVENASFMPWLLGIALIHSLSIVEKRKSLQTWVLLLSVLTFLLSVIGTFLVRSGILTSVHTFALDPARGIYILAFIALLGGYSLILFAVKSKNFLNKQYFIFFSREGSILVNNILMVIVCASVFLGTIYPLLVEVFSNNKISVGEPYFNSTTIPVIIPAILVMGIGPILSWGKMDIMKTLKKTFPAIIVTIVISYIFFWAYKPYDLLGLVGIFLSLWIMSNIMLLLIQKIIIKNKKITEDIMPKNPSGMILAHLGIALLILGITGSSIWQEEKIVRMKVNDQAYIHNYNIVFKEINKIRGPNYFALQGDFWIYDNKKNIIAKLKPENRFYPVTSNSTTEASIDTDLLRDLYIVLGEGDKANGWVVRIYYNPLVMWIWIGAFIVFLGGIVAIKNNLKFFKQSIS